MNTKNAQYIMTIARRGSITAAAKELYISQPALSQTIKAIELELGATIFERKGKQLCLTAIGQKYVENMREIITLEKNMLAEIGEMKKLHSATLKVGISTQRAISLLPQILPEFIEKYPLVSIEIIELPSVRLEEFLPKGGCDIAFITTNIKQDDIEYKLLEKEQIVLMASRKTDLAKRITPGTEISLKEAKKENFINLSEGHSVRNIQDRLTEHYHINPKVLLEMFNMEAAKLITAQLNAVMVCPYGYIQNDSRIEHLINCYPLKCHGYERNFFSCYSKGLRLTVYMQDLYEIALSKCSHHTMNS